MTSVRTVDLESVEVVTPVRQLRATRALCRINVDTAGQSFGDRVQDLREQRGLTQTQLASMCGLSVQPIRNVEWERGWCVHAETVARIIRALDTTFEALYLGEKA